MLEKAVSVSAFSGWQRVRMHALLVGSRIDLRALYRTDSLAVAPLAIPAGVRGMAVLFRYGAVDISIFRSSRKRHSWSA
jgi:hypothetical protein